MTTLTRWSHSSASVVGERTYRPATAGLEVDALLIARRAESEIWSQRIDCLLAIRLLEDNWDGQGAKAPAAALVDSAIVLAQLFRQNGAEPPSRVVPGVNGTIIFEWQSGGAYCEIEVTQPFRAEAMKVIPGQPPEHWLITGE